MALYGEVRAVDLLRGHLGGAEDGDQQVVEVVCDAAGELADRFELLRLPQLMLEIVAMLLLEPALGHVLERPDEAPRTVGVGDQAPVRVNVADLSVSPNHPVLERERPARLDRMVDLGERRAPCRRDGRTT